MEVSRRVIVMFGLASLVPVVPTAHAQDQLWARQFGTSGYWDSVRALLPDGSGGVMVAGGIENAQGVEGPFLARYDSAGNRLWMRRFGTNRWDRAHALAPDGAGGAFVAGWTEGRLGGSHAGNMDAWIARYDNAGNRLWIRQYGTNVHDRIFALATDGTGGVMVAGDTNGSLVEPNAGAYDVIIARYDSAGNRMWIRQFGVSGDDNAWGVTTDGAGGLIVAGSTQGSLFEPNVGSGEDVFLARYDNQGNRIWARQFGTDRSDFAWAVATDGSGGAFVAGEARGDLGAPIPNIGPFLARYDSNGDRLWVRQFGLSISNGSGKVAALWPDDGGGAIMAGQIWGDLGGPSAGRVDAYLGGYDGAGNQLWLRQFGTPENDVALAVTLDGAGGAVVGGWTEGNLIGQNAGERDAFLARFSVCAPCDMNCDGSIDAFDIEPFLDLLFDPNAKPCNTCTGDVDADGNVNAFDIEPFLNCLFGP